jgi:hypothetical protein
MTRVELEESDVIETMLQELVTDLLEEEVAEEDQEGNQEKELNSKLKKNKIQPNNPQQPHNQQQLLELYNDRKCLYLNYFYINIVKYH